MIHNLLVYIKLQIGVINPYYREDVHEGVHSQVQVSKILLELIFSQVIQSVFQYSAIFSVFRVHSSHLEETFVTVEFVV